jgi:hypothetical protein
LRNEILLEGVKSKGTALSAFEPIVHRMIQDVQERLIFRASVFIGENIRNYKAKPEDLNYPERLAVINNDAKANYENWYPTLGITLNLLSKLYRALDIGVFESLAQEAVSLCSSSFIDASKKIAEKKTVMDAELFSIKHLLTLCEQLSAFNVNFRTTQVVLDFSQLRDGISRFLRGQSGFNVQSIIFDIMSSSRPRIVQNNIDSKKDLENQLRSVCESFIVNVARSALDPLMTFLKKLSSHKKSTGSNQGYANVSEVKELYQTFFKSLTEVLPTLKKKMSDYLSSPSTREDLLKHIKTQLIDIYQEFLNYLDTGFSKEEAEELKQMAMTIPNFMTFVNEQLELSK